MNPIGVQQPAMTPQMPSQAGQMPQSNPWSPSMAQPSSPQQAAIQNQGKNKAPQMPSQPFTASHHHIYNTLRNSLMSLVQQGVPGIEKVLASLNNEHVNGMKSQAQQAPTMPQSNIHPETGQLQRQGGL